MRDEIADGLASVRARIEAAAARAGRDPAEVTLVAVTKQVDPDRVARAIDLGVTDVGENRVQELLAKQAAVAPVARWHMIGTLQRNKVARVVGRVALIHAVDSPALAEAIGARASGGAQDVLLEVNTSGEETKHGIDPADVPAVGARIASVPGIRLRGLMTIAAAGGGEAARVAFRALRRAGDRLGVEGATELSMGMSDDFEVAVEEGATIVRVGTAIFGPRPHGLAQNAPAGGRAR